MEKRPVGQLPEPLRILVGAVEMVGRLVQLVFSLLRWAGRLGQNRLHFILRQRCE